jgi:hypothetical protein
MWISSESKLQNLIMRSGTIMKMETESRESKRRASDEEESAATVGKVILISSFRAQLFYELFACIKQTLSSWAARH